MTKILATIRSSFGVLLLMTVLLGVVYPLLIMGMSQTLFHHRANGSLIERGGKIIGSTLLGQEFANEWYFWSRPSATSPAYNAAASSGSNLSPRNPALLDNVIKRREALLRMQPSNQLRVPVDLITASASGLDPHITAASAQYQLQRVAEARRMKPEEVQALIAQNSEFPLFGLIGEPYINVLHLNLALDEASKQRAP